VDGGMSARRRSRVGTRVDVDPCAGRIRRYSPSPSQTRGRARPPRAAMAKQKKKKEIVFLVCEETGDRNYTIMKKPGTNKLELKKYSPRLRKHTKHVEKKK
jgi:large subunit ribosomal protein L33